MKFRNGMSYVSPVPRRQSGTLTFLRGGVNKILHELNRIEGNVNKIIVGLCILIQITDLGG